MRFVIAFLLKSKHLLISWLQSPSRVILEPKKIKSLTVSIVSSSICYEVMGQNAVILVFWMLSFKPTFSPSSFTFVKRFFSSSFQFYKSEFCNKELMVWATVSSKSCFCWLYRASPSLAAKNTINWISVLTIWWCLRVESSLVLLEGEFGMTTVFSWQNSVNLCPASFCTPRPNLPIIPGISWLPIFAFQSSMRNRTSFLGVSSRRSYRSSLKRSTSASPVLLVGA